MIQVLCSLLSIWNQFELFESFSMQLIVFNFYSICIDLTLILLQLTVSKLLKLLHLLYLDVSTSRENGLRIRPNKSFLLRVTIKRNSVGWFVNLATSAYQSKSEKRRRKFAYLVGFWGNEKPDSQDSQSTITSQTVTHQLWSTICSNISIPVLSMTFQNMWISLTGVSKCELSTWVYRSSAI